MYRMQMLYQFDVRDDPMYVMDAKLVGNKVVFESTNGEVSGSGILKDGVYTGKFQADEVGEFKMKRIVRLSPTMGAKAPKGAIVLFDGKNLDAWERMGGASGTIDLAKLIGGDNVAAYVGTLFASDIEQKAVLEVGSDDGVKVWVNGEVVHTNNASRGVTPGEDKIAVTLKEGMNSVMLKVVNGGGGWGACARFADEKGKSLTDRLGLKSELNASRTILVIAAVLSTVLVQVLSMVGFSIVDLVFAIYGAQVGLCPLVISYAGPPHMMTMPFLMKNRSKSSLLMLFGSTRSKSPIRCLPNSSTAPMERQHKMASSGMTAKTQPRKSPSKTGTGHLWQTMQIIL